MNQKEKNTMARRLGRWQKTFDHAGYKIKISMRSRTRNGDFIGFSSLVSDNEGHEMRISLIEVSCPKTAQQTAYDRFVEEVIL